MANYLFNYFNLFNNARLGSIRAALDSEGCSWFLAKDVSAILGYANQTDAYRVHTKESDRKTLQYKVYRETRLASLWGNNDFSNKVFINEAGLYQMIMESELPGAEEFKDWVTHEVIPSIRKHGGYILGQERLEDPTELHKQIEELQARCEKESAGKAKLNGYLQQTEDLNYTLLGENKELKKQVDDLKEKLEALERENYLLKNPQPEIKGNNSEITFYVGEDGLLFPFDFKNL